MTEPHFDDEDLMAFADGEADPPLRAAIERAIASDSDLAARVQKFSSSRAQAKSALRPLLDEPVPDDLLARITAMVDEQTENANVSTQNVVQLRPRTTRLQAFTSSKVVLPLAASIMLIAGGVAGFFLGQSNIAGTSGVQMVSLDRQEVAQALNTVLSGKQIPIGEEGDRFRAISTFIDAEKTLCREFEVDQVDQASIVAVACRADNTWEVQFTVVAGQNNDGYAPASSLQAMDAYLLAIGADTPLSAEAEAAAIKAAR